MQIAAQRRWYEVAYSRAWEQIVMLDAAPIARFIIDRGNTAGTLVDISLRLLHRNQGIGGGLLRDLLWQCGRERMPAKLQVLRDTVASVLPESTTMISSAMPQDALERTRDVGLFVESYDANRESHGRRIQDNTALHKNKPDR